jgi:predicted GIY-YIG superfamily endonuclease
MHGSVYKLSFPDGTFYIGQTIQSLNKRLHGHKSHSNVPYHNSPIDNKLRQYSLSDIKQEIIDSANTQIELNDKETKHIILNASTTCLNRQFNRFYQINIPKEPCNTDRYWEDLTKRIINIKYAIHEQIIYNYNIKYGIWIENQNVICTRCTFSYNPKYYHRQRCRMLQLRMY